SAILKDCERHKMEKQHRADLDHGAQRVSPEAGNKPKADQSVQKRDPHAGIKRKTRSSPESDAEPDKKVGQRAGYNDDRGSGAAYPALGHKGDTIFPTRPESDHGRTCPKECKHAKKQRFHEIKPREPSLLDRWRLLGERGANALWGNAG